MIIFSSSSRNRIVLLPQAVFWLVVRALKPYVLVIVASQLVMHVKGQPENARTPNDYDYDNNRSEQY